MSNHVQITGTKNIGVMTLTFLGHVTSSVTWPFEYQWVSPSVFEMFGIKHIWVTTLSLLGHVTSSVTWPFESQWSISYWWSIGPKSLSPAVFEIFGPKYIEVTTLAFQGHVTSSVTWPFDSQVVISYRCSIGTNSVSPTVVDIMGPKYIYVSWPLPFWVTWRHQSRDHSNPNGPFPIGGPLDPIVSIFNGFRDIPPQTSCRRLRARLFYLQYSVCGEKRHF